MGGIVRRNGCGRGAPSSKLSPDFCQSAIKIQSLKESTATPVASTVSMAPGMRLLQGKTADAAERLIEDAALLEEKGAFAILVELVPDRVCRIVTESARVPIISLGSGPHAHGQLLIFHDLFGLYPDFTPRIAKRYRDAGALLLKGLTEFVSDVRERRFPGAEQCFGIAEEELAELERRRRRHEKGVGTTA